MLIFQALVLVKNFNSQDEKGPCIKILTLCQWLKKGDRNGNPSIMEC